jgi:hypothetical protein
MGGSGKFSRGPKTAILPYAPPHLQSKNDSANYAFLNFFKVVAIGCNALPEPLHPIEQE